MAIQYSGKLPYGYSPYAVDVAGRSVGTLGQATVNGKSVDEYNKAYCREKINQVPCKSTGQQQ